MKKFTSLLTMFLICFSLVRAQSIKEVKIGTQVWMSDNLNIKTFQNGEIIRQATSRKQWNQLCANKQPAWCYYNFENKEDLKYGKIYNFYAVINQRGLAPKGWHIPSDCEWMYLEHGIGMSLSEQTLNVMRADNADNQGTPGYKLRSAGIGQTNASGFSALVNGYRIADGTFVNSGAFGTFWTSSAVSATNAPLRYLWSGKRGVGRNSDLKALALNVRCLKD